MDEQFQKTYATRSAQGKRGLEPQWYLDSAVFDFEIDQLFSRAWVVAGYAQQLKQAGDYFRVEIQGADCVVLQDTMDQLRAFQNVCRHRGTQLCTAAAGHTKTSLVCPYHGWKYDLQGNLISAPNMQNVDGFEAQEFGLHELRLTNWNGLLIANQQESESTFPLAKLDAIAESYQLAEYEKVESIEYDVAANWKLFFQNFNECYHCPSVHPQLTPYSDYRESSNDFSAGDVLGGPMKIRDAADSITTDGKYCGSLPKFLPDAEQQNARYYTVFPNLFVSLFPDYAMIHRLKPLQKDRTHITCDFLFHQSMIQSTSFAPEKASQFWDLTNRQDWEMCERVQQGLGTPGFRPSPYSNLESLLSAFDGHYLAQMESLGFQFP